MNAGKLRNQVLEINHAQSTYGSTSTELSRKRLSSKGKMQNLFQIASYKHKLCII